VEASEQRKRHTDPLITDGQVHFKLTTTTCSAVYTFAV
jgi:hypothetical protein